MASIAFDSVSKVFQDGTRAVDALDLEVADGGFTVLVGPSGSGKSTALRMVAGLEESSSGQIRIADRVVNDVAPKDRDIAMVFGLHARREPVPSPAHSASAICCSAGHAS